MNTLAGACSQAPAPPSTIQEVPSVDTKSMKHIAPGRTRNTKHKDTSSSVVRQIGQLRYKPRMPFLPGIIQSPSHTSHQSQETGEFSYARLPSTISLEIIELVRVYSTPSSDSRWQPQGVIVRPACALTSASCMRSMLQDNAYSTTVCSLTSTPGALLRLSFDELQAPREPSEEPPCPHSLPSPSPCPPS